MARLRPETHDAVAAGARQSAEVILPLIAASHFNGAPGGMLDVGAGRGHWLDVAEQLWPDCKLAGVDIEASRGGLVHEWDAESGASLGLWHGHLDGECIQRRWPLVLCLEVAEHLSPDAGDHLIRELSRVAKRVLWSAAIPGQGGDGHVNEQWPAYWGERFNQHGFFLTDPWRLALWNDERVEPWYRQNLLLAKSGVHDPNDAHLYPLAMSAPPHLVHPAVFQAKIGLANYWRDEALDRQAELRAIGSP